MHDRDITQLQHTRLVPSTKVQSVASRAANVAADAGLSPRQQIDAARKMSGAKLVYLPHQGMRERQRNLRRLELAAAKQ